VHNTSLSATGPEKKSRDIQFKTVNLR